MHIIDGTILAKRIIDGLAARGGAWKEKFCAAFLIGENQESKALGLDFRIYRIATDSSNDEVRKFIGTVVRGSTCGGALVQLPLPEKFNEQAILNAIPKDKDIDCLSEAALGGFYTGRGEVSPPPVAALEAILKEMKCDPSGKNVVVAGRGRLIGMPIIHYFLRHARTVSSVYLEHEDDMQALKSADIIVSGVGKPELIKGQYIKTGAILVDFGYGRKDGRISGDVDIESCEKSASFCTKTPGGTGPMVVVKLFENFCRLNGGM
jgi:methylenetetrahydrofolate dehydrogenase (NADP+)/methenyltetrahydrofolate cyclohydrolase